MTEVAKQLQDFQTFILHWFARYGRHTLPWRQTTDPYAVLLSELMLQQTQVNRVIPKYQAFLARFPSLATLATADLTEVLSLWQGLGYNRRARYLHALSQQTTTLPTLEKELLTLPGIGAYTAAAITAFAYNQPTILIETNVRSVFLYHFFPGRTGVHDQEILPLLQASLPQKSSRVWYYALMDYGSHLKTVVPNPSRSSKHHNKQSTFAGSLRQTRGQIIKLLLTHQSLTFSALRKRLNVTESRLQQALAGLIKDTLLTNKHQKYSIAKTKKAEH